MTFRVDHPAALRLFLTTVFALALVSCKPAYPPADILGAQREVLEKAKSLDGQLQQRAAERMQEVDASQK